MYPQIRADLSKLQENVATVSAACKRAGVHLCAVSKAFCADESVLDVFNKGPVDSIGDSRLKNLQGMRSDKPKVLLRLSDPRETDQVVACCQLSLQSEVHTLRALARSALRLGRRHQVILMVDLGDLREGLMYTDRTGILTAAREVKEASALGLAGVGVNLTCFGGIIPDRENLSRLAGLAVWLRQELNLPIPIVSGGNSSTLGLLFQGELPAGINHLRVGEGILLGRDTATGEPFPQLHQDVFTLSAALGEVQQKPSRPLGLTGPNAFGEAVSFPDMGTMRRGIALVGRQDTDWEGLTPRDPRVKVLGASSDHLLVDLSGAPEYQVGDVLDFDVRYGALLKAYTSRYVARVS